MGVPALWSLVKEQSQCITFNKFIQEYYSIGTDGQKPLRIVVDGELWIQESLQSSRNELNSNNNNNNNNIPNKNSPNRDSKQFFNIFAFFAKLKCFQQYNIELTLIFDGSFKPTFKKCQHVSQSTILPSTINTGTIDDYLKAFERHIKHFHSNNNSVSNILQSCCSKLKFEPRYYKAVKILEYLQIPYFFTCSEAEAFCSVLQCTLENFGNKFDFVLSNDSDVLMFGARKVIRNFSKRVLNPANSKSLSPRQQQHANEYSMEVVDLTALYQKVSLCQTRFILSGILIGGDYNIGGINGVGISKVRELLFEPSFKIISEKFLSCYHSTMNNNTNSCNDKRNQLILDFQKYFTKFLKHSLGIANVDKLIKDWPSEYIIMSYVKPLIPVDDNADFSKIDLCTTGITTLEMDFSNLLSFYKFLCERTKKFTTEWLHRNFHELYILNYIHYLQNDTEKLFKLFTITSEKYDTDGGDSNLLLLKIRYNSFIPDIPVPESKINSNKKPRKIIPVIKKRGSPTKRQLEIIKHSYHFWIPQLVFEKFDTVLHQAYLTKREAALELEAELSLSKPGSSRKKRSPNKRSLEQVTTLDSIGFFSNHTTPKNKIIFRTNCGINVNSDDSFVNNTTLYYTATTSMTGNKKGEEIELSDNYFTTPSKHLCIAADIGKNKKNRIEHNVCSEGGEKYEKIDTDDEGDESLIIVGEVQKNNILLQEDEVDGKVMDSGKQHRHINSKPSEALKTFQENQTLAPSPLRLTESSNDKDLTDDTITEVLENFEQKKRLEKQASDTNLAANTSINYVFNTNKHLDPLPETIIDISSAEENCRNNANENDSSLVILDEECLMKGENINNNKQHDVARRNLLELLQAMDDSQEKN
ncbi:crossover junction endodeoxyribonuclease SCDLUD_002293 [Saccharomycodes ludwigii]|uniref:crossover junction endodeoxyribonuclease n=1 Tax=Saccharomycodes ludwigii TaxID=36035 RepID=UPI001E87FC86|nr:hypothetical protein SCDLUD_002293 [Saccharomycodes ludwigii]KAH3900839.1 hypothetical protein SCDLUD_002293 [Saccharomycodes ludwigii]